MFFCSGSRRKLSTLAIYTEEDSSIDMSGLASAADVNDSSDKSKINVSYLSSPSHSHPFTGDSESQ